MLTHKKFLFFSSFLILAGLAIAASVGYFRYADVSTPTDSMASIVLEKTEPKENMNELKNETPSPSEVIEETKVEELIAAEKQSEKIEETEEFDDATLMKEALEKGSVDACQKIKETKIKSQCLDGINFTLAIETNNATLCNEIQSQESKEYCSDQVNLRKAKSNLEYEFCKKIQERKTLITCVEEVDTELQTKAKTFQDCQSIKTKEIREKCIFRFQMQELASDNESDVNPCLKLTDKEQQKECLINLVMQKALHEGSEKICKTIQDAHYSTICTDRVKEKLEKERAEKIVERGKASTCSAILDGKIQQKCKDKANYESMIKEKDLSYCDQIESEKLKEQCESYGSKLDLYWLMKAQKEMRDSFCQNISNEEVRTECVEVVEELVEKEE